MKPAFRPSQSLVDEQQQHSGQREGAYSPSPRSRGGSVSFPRFFEFAPPDTRRAVAATHGHLVCPPVNGSRWQSMALDDNQCHGHLETDRALEAASTPGAAPSATALPRGSSSQPSGVLPAATQHSLSSALKGRHTVDMKHRGASVKFCDGGAPSLQGQL